MLDKVVTTTLSGTFARFKVNFRQVYTVTKMTEFGFQREKRLLAKLIEQQHPEKYQAFVQKLVAIHGADKVTNWVVNDILPRSSSDSMAWCYRLMLGDERYALMNQKAVETLVEILVDKGHVPGKDFSIHPEGGLILSSHASESILEDVPEEFRDMLRAESLQAELPDAQAILEASLGVPFIANLLSRIETRIPTLTDAQAVGYLVSMGAGVEEKTQIELFPMLMYHIKSKFPERFKVIWENIKAENWEKPGSEVGLDLIIAAGGESELLPHPEESGEYIITRKGLQILASVFQGERNIYELIAALDAHQRQKTTTEEPEP